MDTFFRLIILAGAITGASTGLLGVYIIGLRIPFIGVCISHAAMAGVIFGILLNLNPTLAAIGVSMIVATSVATINPDRVRLQTNVGLAILFSLMLGLIFLGIGLVRGSRTEVLSLLWGSLLFVQVKTVWLIGLTGLALSVFAMLFNKELKAILFSRSIAAATGVHDGLIYSLFLALCGIVLSVNLKTIGGLMIFSLITNPAAAAYQICTGHKSVVITSTFLGMLSAVAGFLVSFYSNLPTGACIVVVSTLIFALAATYRNVLRKKD